MAHAFAKFLVTHESLVRYWQKLKYQHIQDGLFLVHPENIPLQLERQHEVSFLQSHQTHHHHYQQCSFQIQGDNVVRLESYDLLLQK
ncbi:hypothetical protein D3C71_1069080 [compost metagenome]